MLDSQQRGARPWPTKKPLDPEQAAADRQHKIAQALEIWRETVPAAGTLIEVYLWSRLLMIPPPPAIRLHRSLHHSESGERRPGMVARVDHIEHGFVGVHRTYLAIDGSQKATLDPVRKSLGPIGGGAVRLAQLDPQGWLAVTEGIETGLSVLDQTGIPVWAALSAGGIESLVLPDPGVAPRVLICADNDANGRGEAAARNAALRWLAEGREVRLALPAVIDSDFNDMLLKGEL